MILLLGAITVGAVLLAQNNQKPSEEQNNQQSQSSDEETIEEEQPTQPKEEEAQQEESSEEQDTQKLAEEFAQEKQEWYLLLANVDNPLPQDFTVETEVVQNSFEMDARVAQTMRNMIDAAAKDGVDLLVCSAYRSIEKQQTLFDEQVQIYLNQGKSRQEAYDLTASAIAIPGTSEHHTGLAADIVTPTHQTLDPEFADTEAGQWLQEHAWEYGFVLRYPEDKQDVTKIIYESWHYRFVGKTHAKLMKESGLCLEEYLQQEVPEGYTGISDPFADPQVS
ncbi:D-alanyl-D-alanine carboxypeptidase family protein [uncultured Negativibacillus sp.]|uniref:M15 family metallopeptidase n=1 Tax=uncultured Negativibacillus sp. TaxID=1980696 RepID=UPI0025E6A9C4|nr:M15 family metallopeptidase [uncultured Negativibacillus sp.]